MSLSIFSSFYSNPRVLPPVLRLFPNCVKDPAIPLSEVLPDNTLRNPPVVNFLSKGEKRRKRRVFYLEGG